MLDRGLIRIALLGALTGFMASMLVLAFRASIEIGQHYFLPDGKIGNYEALPGWARLALPLGGALLLGLVFERLPKANRGVGIVHVIDYLRFRKQSLPFRNALVQFFGGIVAILSGHSVDREGPGVHLGAANAALIGRRMRLDEDEDYLLAAAGGAAAIAAAYNTPLAGVIFVIEVLRVRYAVNHIVPVIVASVIGAVFSRLVYGHSPAFAVPPLAIGSLSELPVIMLLGLVIGVLASAFIAGCQHTARLTMQWRPLYALLAAGLVTGVLAQWAPQIMGVSYDTLDRMLENHVLGSTLLIILVAKLIATAVSVGARVPGGLIGPSLIIGGAVGAIAEGIAQQWYPWYAGSNGFYTMIGMVAMMGAVLRAPLAALVALMELTGNLNIILPGMIAVVIAELATRSLSGDVSAFTVLLAESHKAEAVTPPIEESIDQSEGEESAEKSEDEDVVKTAE